MSWLNSSLSQLKGQLTNLAQEVLAETAGPGDLEYEGHRAGGASAQEAEQQAKTALELLADTQEQKEQLDRRCEEKDREIAALRRELAKSKQKQESKLAASTSASREPHLQQNEEPNVEDSWCWEPDGGDEKGATGAGSGDAATKDKESGLVDIALGNNDVVRLNERIAELEQLNAQLNASLEELDSQHELAMQDVLEHKTQLAGQVANLKQLQADRLVEHELANARQQKQLDELRQTSSVAKEQQEELQRRVEQQEAELNEMRELLDKRRQDTAELIERVRLAETERERLLKDLEESRQAKEKKTSESSSNSSSTGKHSEDEFIVVRQADATGSGSASGSDRDPDADVTSPPSKEKLRDRLVSLESQISELTLTNTQLQDAQLEKQLSINLLGEQLVELEKRLRLSEAEKEQLQLDLQLRLQQLTVQNQELKLHAEAEQEGHAQDLEEQLGALREDNQRLRQELTTSIAQAKFRQAIAEEKQEITDLDDADTEYGTFELDKLRDLLQAEMEDRLASSFPQQKLERAWNSLKDRWHRLELLEQRLEDVQNQQLVSEHEKKTLEADISQYILQCDELMKNNELLLNELDKYKRNKLETIEEHHEETIVQLEAQLEEARQKLEASLSSQQLMETKLKSSPEKSPVDSELLAKLEQKDQEYLLLQEQLTTANTELDNRTKLLEKNAEQLTKQQQQNASDQKKLEELSHLRETLQRKEVDLKELEEQLTSVRQDLDEKSVQLKISQDQHKIQVTNLQNQLQADQEKLRELLQLQDKLEQQKELMEVDQNQQITMIKKELAEMTNQLSECQERLTVKEAQLAEIQRQLREVNEERTTLQEQLLNKEQESGKNSDQASRLHELEDQLLAKEQQIQLDQAELEKLHEALRANEEQLLAKEEQLQAKESQIQTLESQLQGQQAADESQQLQQTIDGLAQEKNELIKVLQQKHQENTQYYAEIQRLQPFEQQLKELAKEREKLQDQVGFLKEKSDILTTNLLTEQTNQRLLQQQQAESQEQQTSALRDLERLRAHLLEIEELHTQETVELQRDLDESRSRQAILEQQVSKSSTAYTSASIRANQQAETLQAQHALLQQQRDELLAKLGQYEDRELKQQAALTNLQCALEQFQNDKDHDIEMATQRIRREMQTQLDRQGQLQLEMSGLQQQLAEANQGLRAAARLSDQLEAGQQTIAVLRDEVESLKEANGQLEQRLSSSESSQTDKIDKSLIKSLLIGYVVSGHAGDKQQVLRMISSVLDFNAQEADKVGLNKQQSSWLGAILGGGTAPAAGAGSSRGNENLVQAFVQFLEQESQPQAQSRPTLLSMTGQMDGATSPGAIATATSTSATSAHLPPAAPFATATPAEGQQDPAAPGTLPVGGSPQSLAMGSNEFAPTRNSSSILKDILSDS
ncbi:thyroid receptor-interacting protein 11 isoform X1 [Drosophila santomea]|uniref:thyroid receptor-interacting protein 11 isoform X1 n=2 Tax=Drosophila santomea TaxID=129105 RepID=UPI001953E78E|nr:thyroid receptor-interacting protein 11 isoform X1 [Drosophila santomea]